MRICLDAGHYKNYNQGVVKGYIEGDIMWKLTNLQKKYLEEYKNIEIILTRSNISQDLTLTSRGAKSKGCDLFISNHSNACGSESVDRPVIIYAYDNKNNSYEVGNKLGAKIKEVMGTKQSHQMMQKKTNSGGEYYGVMRSSRAAGCQMYFIVEHGFHTNENCCNWLMNDSNLEKLAKAEVGVIAAYYGLKKKEVYTSKDFLIKIDTNVLNVRSGPSTSYSITTKVKKGEVYTIVEQKSNWGKLKSGAGWICLDYIKKV